MTRRAFTLIEMMVVIAIIAILIAVAFVAGQRVMAGGRSRLTADTIKVLDQALEAYIQEKGTNPPALVEDPRAETDTAWQDLYWPASDVAVQSGGGGGPTGGGGGYETLNSVDKFKLSAEDVPGLAGIFEGLDPRIIKTWNSDANPLSQPNQATIYDGWGAPIRYVHPALDGVIEAGGTHRPGSQGDPVDLYTLPGFTLSAPKDYPRRVRYIRRSVLTDIDRDQGATGPGDSDGGICPGGRPYFYSAGPDADPSTTIDNVYTITPQFEKPE